MICILYIISKILQHDSGLFASK